MSHLAAVVAFDAGDCHKAHISGTNRILDRALHTIDRLVAVLGEMTLLVAVAALDLARLGAFSGHMTLVAAVVASTTTAAAALRAISGEVAHLGRLAAGKVEAVSM